MARKASNVGYKQPLEGAVGGSVISDCSDNDSDRLSENVENKFGEVKMFLRRLFFRSSVGRVLTGQSNIPLDLLMGMKPLILRYKILVYC